MSGSYRGGAYRRPRECSPTLRRRHSQALLAPHRPANRGRFVRSDDVACSMHCWNGSKNRTQRFASPVVLTMPELMSIPRRMPDGSTTTAHRIPLSIGLFTHLSVGAPSSRLPAQAGPWRVELSVPALNKGACHASLVCVLPTEAATQALPLLVGHNAAPGPALHMGTRPSALVGRYFYSSGSHQDGPTRFASC